MTAVFATIYYIVSVEHRPATLDDIRETVRGTRGQVLAAVLALRNAARVRRVIAWGADAGPADKHRFVYVPNDRALARGIGFCSTPDCPNDPELYVAGHTLCRCCARGPVDRQGGGGQFRDEASEAYASLCMVVQHYDASTRTGGWEPADGGERIPHPTHHGATMTTAPRGARQREPAPPALAVGEAEREFAPHPYSATGADSLTYADL